MKVIVLSIMSITALAACATEPETVGEASQAISYPVDIFYDKFNSLNPGSIYGQAGWSIGAGTVNACQVVADSNTDKNLYCSDDGSQNGQGALHTFQRLPGHDYHFQFDAWMLGVTQATHGKVFIENYPGDGSNTVFQIALGCNPVVVPDPWTGASHLEYHAKIRATFEYHGETQKTLLEDVDCTGHYRVACNWHDGGWQLRCGASRLPYDPVESTVIDTPEPLGPFSLVRVLGGIGFNRGTTVYDKVQVLSN